MHHFPGKEGTVLKDQEIVALFRQRSEEAIEELNRKYGRQIRQVTDHVLRDRQDAEECASDTCLQVWNSIPPGQPEHLGAYACKIARNLAINRYRSNSAKKRNTFYDVALDELEETVPALSNVETEYEARELTGYVNQFLRSLEPDDRVLFLRRYWFGDSVSEIASATGRKPHALSVRLFRLRQRLQDYLKKEGMMA